ncbi:MAG: M48 family metalloprotease [Verrucomicrobia bacterium]|nr:M48 family metalloprotease [Verrucomicrobiota bacterium]
MGKNPSWGTDLAQDIKKKNPESKYQGPKTLSDKIIAEETWSVGLKLAKCEPNERSYALTFIIQHELGHVHHKHNATGPSQRKKAWGPASVVFLASSLLEGGAAFFLHKLPLKFFIPICAGFGSTSIFSGALTRALVSSRLQRSEERQADCFGVSSDNKELAQHSKKGGEVLFQAALESGREARGNMGKKLFLITREICATLPISTILPSKKEKITSPIDQKSSSS